MSDIDRDYKAQLDEEGYLLISEVCVANQLSTLIEQSRKAFDQHDDAVRKREGAVYAARNVLDLWPEVKGLLGHITLSNWLVELMGPTVGLVRGLFFDKPPEQTWSLPWHKDQLIAVEEHQTLPKEYSSPRKRVGVDHTEPPVEVLESMLTARIHLDDMTPENGPLEVLPGSHKSGKELVLNPFTPVTLHCRAGDVLFMRPLLAHASGKSKPDCQDHRRILHLEFSTLPVLPGNVRWHRFLPVPNSGRHTIT